MPTKSLVWLASGPVRARTLVALADESAMAPRGIGLTGNLTDGDIPALVGWKNRYSAGKLLSLFPTSSVGSEIEGGGWEAEEFWAIPERGWI